MSNFKIQVDLKQIDLSSLETDHDFRRAAQKLLPEALCKAGEFAGEEAWKTLQKQLKRSGAAGSGSNAERSRFVKKAGMDYQKSATMQQRRELETEIVSQLRQAKEKNK